MVRPWDYGMVVIPCTLHDASFFVGVTTTSQMQQEFYSHSVNISGDTNAFNFRSILTNACRRTYIVLSICPIEIYEAQNMIPHTSSNMWAYGSAKELKASRTDFSMIREQMVKLKQEANLRTRFDKKATVYDKPPLRRNNNGPKTGRRR